MNGEKKHFLEVQAEIERIAGHLHNLLDSGTRLSKLIIAIWFESLRNEIEIRQSSREAKTESRLMTVKEAADYLRMHEGTLRAWANQGEIPYRRIKSEIRFDRQEIDEYSRREFHALNK